MFGLWCDTNHPALTGFPTEANCDWQWTQILRGVRPMNLDRLPRGLQPIVQAIDDWNRNWKLGALFECRTGKGRLMVSSFDLMTDPQNRPVARQLLRSLLDYMGSERFQPKTEVSVAEFRTVLFDTRIMRKLEAKAEGEGPVASAIDGDPNTYWVTGGTGRNATGRKHPHQLTVSFPKSVAMNGVVIMPRQNDRDHLGDVRQYKLESSEDGQQWTELSQGELPSSWNPQRIAFERTITARQLRFTALSGYGRDTSVALAELAVVYAGPKLGDKEFGAIEYRRSRSTSADVDEGGDAPVVQTNAIPRNP
jgi:beta-galactosidase